MTDNKKEEQHQDYNYHKKWIVYNKEDIIEKLNECLDSVLKYFNSCFQQKENIVFNLHVNHYIQSRIQNIHNLCASLLMNDELEYNEFQNWLRYHDNVTYEFNKHIHTIDIRERIKTLQVYIDATLDLSVLREEEEDFEDAINNQQETMFSESDDDYNEDELSEIDESNIPDDVSIISVNNNFKKPKL